jgi:hypothetical protein
MLYVNIQHSLYPHQRLLSQQATRLGFTANISQPIEGYQPRYNSTHCVAPYYYDILYILLLLLLLLFVILLLLLSLLSFSYRTLNL